jgi:hypothetical protein
MKLLNVENKHIDTQVAASGNAVNSGSSSIIYIAPPGEGSDNNQRTGRSIKVDRIDYTFIFRYSAGSSSTLLQSQTFRWFIVKYLKTPSSSGTSSFGISDFLVTDPNSQYTPLSLPNTDTAENFEILDSGIICLDLQGYTANATAVERVLSGTVNCGFHQTFNNTTYSSVVDNALFVVMVALQGANTGGVSQVGYTMRMWYIDN